MASLAYCHSGPPVKVFFHTKKVYSCWLVQDRRVSPAGGGSSGSAAQDSPPHQVQLWLATTRHPPLGSLMGQGSGRWSLALRSHDGEEDKLVAQGGGGPDDYLGPGAHPGTTRQPLVTSTQECQFSPGPQISPRSSPAGRVRGPAGPTRQRTSSRGSRPPAGSGQAEAAALDLHERPPSIKHSPGSLGGLREG